MSIMLKRKKSLIGRTLSLHSRIMNALQGSKSTSHVCAEHNFEVCHLKREITYLSLIFGQKQKIVFFTKDFIIFLNLKLN